MNKNILKISFVALISIASISCSSNKRMAQDSMLPSGNNGTADYNHWDNRYTSSSGGYDNKTTGSSDAWFEQKLADRGRGGYDEAPQDVRSEKPYGDSRLDTDPRRVNSADAWLEQRRVQDDGGYETSGEDVINVNDPQELKEIKKVIIKRSQGYGKSMLKRKRDGVEYKSHMKANRKE